MQLVIWRIFILKTLFMLNKTRIVGVKVKILPEQFIRALTNKWYFEIAVAMFKISNFLIASDKEALFKATQNASYIKTFSQKTLNSFNLVFDKLIKDQKIYIDNNKIYINKNNYD